MSDQTAATSGGASDGRIEYFRINQWYRTARTLIRWGFGAIIAYQGFEALKVLAGESTSLDIALSLVLRAAAKFEVVVLVSLTGLACAWAIVERNLRYRKVEKMQGRIRELETMLDPNRSTSGLTPAGRTHPRDKGR